MDKQNTKLYKEGFVDVRLIQVKLPEEGIKLVTRKTELNDGSRKNCLTAFRSQFNMPSTKIYSSRTNGRKFFESRKYVQAVCHVAFGLVTYSETFLQCSFCI